MMKKLTLPFLLVLTESALAQSIPANWESASSFNSSSFNSNSADSSSAVTSDKTIERSLKFRKRYEPWFSDDNHLMAKIIDNNGYGAPGLAGNRNVRTVLHGVLYRGGTAESLNPNHDPKSPPMLQSSLENLCKEGFDKAVYLYDANLASKPTSCFRNQTNASYLVYTSQVAVEVTRDRQAIPNPTIIRQLLLTTKMSIEGAIDAPIYVHCWTGRHASGFLAALALRQFCDFTGEEAVNYWNDGTDGAANFPSFHEGIRNFVPYQDLKLDLESQKVLCPSNPYHQLP